MMPDDESDLEALMLQRQAMYEFLARIFRSEADQELLEALMCAGLDRETGVQEIDNGYRALAGWLATVNGTTVDALRIEYARIFLGAGLKGGGAAFPYESVYTSPRGLLMQEARDRVVDWYRTQGLQLAAGVADAEDHLAIELEFVAYLCGSAARAYSSGEMEQAQRYLRAQKAFVAGHLLNWVPRFCGDVERLASSGFYRSIAHIASAYLVEDHELLAQMLADESLPARP